MDKTSKTLAKERLLSALEELTEEKVKELIDFAEFLVLRERVEKSESMLDPDKDPILRLIGSLDVEPFADKIDEELYGIAKYRGKITTETQRTQKSEGR